MKKITLILLFISTSIFGQTTYPSADQDTESNVEGTHLDSGYSNKEAEEEEVRFSGDEEDIEGLRHMPSKHPTPEEQQDASFPEDSSDISY